MERTGASWVKTAASATKPGFMVHHEIMSQSRDFLPAAQLAWQDVSPAACPLGIPEFLISCQSATYSPNNVDSGCRTALTRQGFHCFEKLSRDEDCFIRVVAGTGFWMHCAVTVTRCLCGTPTLPSPEFPPLSLLFRQ